jgi:hypothetical protein
MARPVLLIEPDVDELGALASKLRAHGLEVAIADGLVSAAVRSEGARVGVLLVSSALASAPGFAEALAALPSLLALPRYVLVDGVGGRAEHELPRWDVELIAQRVHALGQSVPVAAAGGDFRGDLKQVSVADLLQLLGSNRRSGTLSLATPSGPGEVRLSEGEVVDAVYRRVDGEKALFRLLGEAEGSFAFVGGASVTVRRIERSSQALLMDGMRQLDETRKRVQTFALGSDLLLAVSFAHPEQRDVEQRLLEALVRPRTLAELLDEVPASDLDVLETLEHLLASGAVRRLLGGHRRVDLAEPERLTVLAALAQRAARAGFESMPRIALAGSQRQLGAVQSSLSRVSDTAVASDVPVAPAPHPLATIRMTDSVSLELVGIPLVDAFAPLWGLVIPSCIAVARLDSEPFEVLEAGCRLASVPLVDGESVLGQGGETDPERVAQLLRTTLERAVGNE